MNVQHIFFVNEHTGWIVLQRPRDVTDEPPAQPTFLLMGTRDGGRTWQSQYQSSNVGVTQLIFSDDEQNGWLTGIAYQKPVLNTYFVLHTNDQGDHWEDVSGELKRVTSNGASNNNEGVMGITWSAPNTATVITRELSVFRTSDEGQCWQQVGSLQGDIATSNVIRRMGTTVEERLWSIGGSNSSQSGTRGVFFMQQDEYSWVKHVLGDVFFQDAVSLLQNRFLATGSVSKLTEVHGTYHATNEAVVLVSLDDGKNWDVVYHNPRIASVNCIYKVNNSLAWAVGEAGLVIKLEDHN